VLVTSLCESDSGRWDFGEMQKLKTEKGAEAAKNTKEKTHEYTYIQTHDNHISHWRIE